MWFIAGILVLTTAVAGPDESVTVWVYRVTAAMLVALAVLTGLTGARTPVVWFKICPGLLGTTAVLLLVASWV